MTVASRIAVMDQGRIRQIAPPAEIYEYPNSRLVAEFIGDVNILEGRIAEAGRDHAEIESAEAGCAIHVDHGVDAPRGATVWVALRPEKLAISKQPPLDSRINCLQGEVWDIGYLGNLSIYHVRLASGKQVTSVQTNQSRLIERSITWEDQVYLTWRDQASIVLTD